MLSRHDGGNQRVQQPRPMQTLVVKLEEEEAREDNEGGLRGVGAVGPLRCCSRCSARRGTYLRHRCWNSRCRMGYPRSRWASNPPRYPRAVSRLNRHHLDCCYRFRRSTTISFPYRRFRFRYRCSPSVRRICWNVAERTWY